jgi:excinuclease UvrABC nuclease subunit
MPIQDDVNRKFSKENVDKSPDAPGVYELSEDGAVIYMGMSQTSIRSRLQNHLGGAGGLCTKKATTYKRETMKAAKAADYEEELLAEYKKAHGGPPKCNENAS